MPIKSIKSKGKDEIKSFKRRVAKNYAEDRISEEDFNELHDSANDLLEKIEEIEMLKDTDYYE